MPYIEKTTKAGMSVIYERCYSSHIHPKGMKREKKENRTTDAQLRINIRKTANELTILLNANFHPGDYHVTMTYFKDERPEEVQEAKEDMRKMLRQLRRRMKKAEKELRYIGVTEVGTRGALHHHIVVPSMPVDWLTEAWGKGRIDIRPLDASGQYSRLAEYMTKYMFQYKKMGHKGKFVCRSKNLYRPPTRKRIVKNRGYFRETPQEKKGFWLDRDTLHKGVSELTGYNFIRYILVEERRGSP